MIFESNRIGRNHITKTMEYRSLFTIVLYNTVKMKFYLSVTQLKIALIGHMSLYRLAEIFGFN